ncbi:MAG TPA: FAD binding domain-containing protein [Polyangiaceae bacterium]|nr:FAD binding domain-containing protein [Polyangiaceae bacterium]
MTVRFLLNGQPVQVDAVEPHVSLLEWLRSAGLPGAKEGCAEGECGACAVAVLRRAANGRARYEAVNSCLVPLASVHDQSITTVEGVAAPEGELHPAQRALVETGGSQCGYCTPGFVMSLFCEYYRPGRTEYDPECISGNLCRCTGYRPIVDAAKALGAPQADDPKLIPLCTSPPARTAFEHHAAGRRFVRPISLSAALEHLERVPDTVPMTGATDLMVYSNLRDQRWTSVLALDAVEELRHFEVTATELTIGAAVTLSEIEAELASQLAGELPLLEHMLALFASRLIRNRATLGGNLATASPIGDSAPALLALDASVTLVSAKSRRRLPLDSLFTGYRKTALAPAELIHSIHVPRPAPGEQRFYKVSKRRLDDISTVAAAFALDLEPDCRIRSLRIAYGGVAETPLRARHIERRAQGLPWDETSVSTLAKELEHVASPLSDQRGSAAYRRAMIVRLFEKFFADTARSEAAQ